MAVHQLLQSLSDGDGTSQAAIHLQLLLRRLGHFGELYATDSGGDFRALVRPMAELETRPEDLVLLHHGRAFGLSAWFTHLPCRLGIVFHDHGPMTGEHEPQSREAQRASLEQLAAMASKVELAIAPSTQTAERLRSLGYRNVSVVPPFVEPERFGLERADNRLLQKLWRRGPTLLAAGALEPNDGIEDTLALLREVQRLRADARLLILADGTPDTSFGKRTRRLVSKTPGAWILDRLPHAGRVAAFQAASVFVSMRTHGDDPPALLEAMAAGRPAIGPAVARMRPADSDGRSPGTLGLAPLAVRLSEDETFRAGLLAKQHEQVHAHSARASEASLAQALGSIGLGAYSRQPRRDLGSAQKPRVALVVQRFGDVSGGAEKHAEQLAQHLRSELDLTVLTSCAQDHLTWANVFPAGEQEVGGLKVIRFPTTRERRLRSFNALSRTLFGACQDRLQEERWLAEQGPLVPGLLQHLAEHGADYDGFIGFTYLYAPLAWGLPLVASRALVVPTAHDEPALRFDVFSDVFERPRALLCNTPEEIALIDRRFPRHARARVVGVGVEAPAADPARFARRHGQHRPYLLYVGRVEAGKGIPELLKHHAALVRRDVDAPDLLLAGNASMRVHGKRVRHLGRISDEDKFDGLAGAIAAVVPSRFESLSLLALEALAQGTPVLVNGASDVLVGQVRRSGAGAVYRDDVSFALGVGTVTSERVALGARGRAFAAAHTWESVMAIYREEMARVLAGA